MKKFIGLLMAAMIVLALSSIAYAGVDFTLEFTRDLDAKETSGFAELVFSPSLDLLDFSLTYTHDFLPDPSDMLEGSVGLTLGPVSLGYERELLVEGPGIATVGLTVGPILLEYEYEFDVDTSGAVTATLEKSF